jgi:large subunit ribosomal protein L47
LTERYYSWRDAETIAKDDPEIDLSGDGPLYVPKVFDEELSMEEFDDEEAQATKAEITP